MGELPPRPPRRSVTNGRPLPPRASTPAAAAAPSVASAVPAAAPASPASPAPAATALTPRPARPDARPMRVVYTAGAAAALSVITVGLVQPDFGQITSEPAEINAESAAATTTRAERRDVRVRHVTRYVQLRPGERAPRGATVIRTDDDRAERRVTRRPSEPSQTRPEPRPRPRSEPRSDTAPEPAAQPNAQPQPKPETAPVTTRQSGG